MNQFGGASVQPLASLRISFKSHSQGLQMYQMHSWILPNRGWVSWISDVTQLKTFEESISTINYKILLSQANWRPSTRAPSSAQSTSAFPIAPWKSQASYHWYLALLPPQQSFFPSPITPPLPPLLLHPIGVNDILFSALKGIGRLALMRFPDKMPLGFSSWADSTKSICSFGEVYTIKLGIRLCT